MPKTLNISRSLGKKWIIKFLNFDSQLNLNKTQDVAAPHLATVVVETEIFEKLWKGHSKKNDEISSGFSWKSLGGQS